MTWHAPSSTEDPFATEALRGRVLRAWAESPARFREDANAEEDYALGGYRDRVVIELAQNAADAALRAGIPGRLRLVLAGGTLSAANTGAPLEASGVEALSTLRASVKRDEPGAAGRFGVGFAAVVAVTDVPSIASAAPGGAVRGVAWSVSRARDLVNEVAELAGEVARRGGGIPLLRLPFGDDPPSDQRPPAGFDTVVRLPLRDAAAEELVRRQLDQVGPALMLALPALAAVEIEVDGVARTLVASPVEPVPGEPPGPGALERAGPSEATSTGRVVIDGVSWRTVEAHGDLDPALLADRPAEERGRPFWRIRWAVPDEPFDGGPGTLEGRRPGLPEGVPAVLHAPTPSDERLDLPALLIATYPMAPDRRHIAPGPLADELTERAAEAYVRLLRELPATPRLLDLIPGPVAAGELDARLRRAVLTRLPEVPLLPADPGAPGDQGRIRGRDALVVDGPAALIDLLRGAVPDEEGDGPQAVLPGLLPVGWPARHPALDALGVRRLETADVIDLLSGLDRPPRWWRRLYGTLAGVDAGSLGALPVPLAAPPGEDFDTPGRLVRGPRGLLVAADGVDPLGLGALEASGLGGPGLRFVHPEAEHPLLIRLGAIEAGPRVVLGDPAVREAVEGADEDAAEPIARSVLDLVAAAGLRPGEQPWLAELALPGDDGELYPAGELLLPGSPLRQIMEDDAPFGVVDAGLVETYGPATLEAAGVLDGFALVRADEVDLTTLAGSTGDVFELDAEETWAGEALARVGRGELPPAVAEFVAVRDLELVGDWDEALPLLAAPPLRAAVTDPVHVIVPGAGGVAVPSYTAWWLGDRPVLQGRRPAEFRLPAGDDLLDGLYDVVPEAVRMRLDVGFLLAIGVRTSLDDLLAARGGVRELLDRMADPSRTVSRARLGLLWTALGEAAEALAEPIGLPERVRTLVDGEPEVVLAEDALVLDSPDLLPLLAGQPLIVGSLDVADRLAELLDLPLAADEVPGEVESAGVGRPVPEAVRAVLPGAPGSYVAHDPLIVDGRRVSWRFEETVPQEPGGAGGVVHAGDQPGLARGLAWAAGRWADRMLVEAVLRDPGALALLLGERDLDPPS